MTATERSGAIPGRGRPPAFDHAEALRTAMKVFWERGYQDASVATLTAAMGIGAPSLYAAFGSKAELFQRAAELYLVDESAAATAALETAPTARAAVEEMLRANVVLFTRRGGPRGCMFTLATTTCPSDDVDVRRYLDRERSVRLKALVASLRRGVVAGDLPKRADVRAIADFYDTVLQGLAVRAREGTSRAELHMVVDNAMAAWDALVGVRSVRRGRDAGPT